MSYKTKAKLNNILFEIYLYMVKLYRKAWNHLHNSIQCHFVREKRDVTKATYVRFQQYQ